MIEFSEEYCDPFAPLRRVTLPFGVGTVKIMASFLCIPSSLSNFLLFPPKLIARKCKIPVDLRGRNHSFKSENNAEFLVTEF